MEQQDRSGVGGSGSGGAGGGGMQRQDQRPHSKPQQQENHHNPPPPQQPQKCPRCDSTNTKFCYYNNYSLSQPRYFCKTCRRYWTQGGTLRNVPVGGGCRKGKRLKTSSSPDNNTSSTSNTATSLPFVSPLRSKTIDQHSLPSSPLLPIGSSLQPSMYYPGGGFLSSLAAYQSFNQPINGGGGDHQFGGSSLSLLPSFNLPFQQMHHLPQQHQQQQQQQHQHIYLHQGHDLNLGSSDGLEEKVSVQANRPSTSHQEWSQTFNSPTHSEATGGGDYWNSSTNTNTTNSNTSTIGVSLNPTHWTDHLAGYGPPPPSQQQQTQSQAQAPPPSTSSSSPPSFL